MEQNVPIMAKKIWHIVRVAFFMLRKGICKRKMLIDLNMMMKRGKIAGKALGNLMFHHHHNHQSHHDTTTSQGGDLQHAASAAAAPEEYEFSCNSTPLYRQYFTKRKTNKNNHNNNYYMPSSYDDVENVSMESVSKVLEMMVSNDVVFPGASPALPGLGFGRSPMPVRQLRITDSPYPIQNADVDNRVDQEAEEFIKRFYSQLKQQKN